MTDREKKRKAALVAVAYYLEQEAAQMETAEQPKQWSDMGKEIMMNNRAMVQRRGRLLRSLA